MIIHDVTGLVDDGQLTDRRLSSLRRVMVHRTGKDLKNAIDLGDTAVDICAHFTGKNTQYPEVAKATGGQLAYTIMIGGSLGAPEYDGMIWQCLALSDVGHHALRFSATAVGVAVIADPRVAKISKKQNESLIWVCSKLATALEIDPAAVTGHSELPGSYRNRNKSCPGEFLNMFEVRRELRDGPREAAIQELCQAGAIV